MKKYFAFTAILIAGLISCNTVKTPFNGPSDFEVESSVKKKTAATVPATGEGDVVRSEDVVALPEEGGSENHDQEQMLLAVENSSSENQIDVDLMKLKIANDLREASKTLDSRFAQRIVNKTANRVEASTAARMEEMNFMQKLHMKMFGKMMAKRVSAARMALADIFAIVSISAGGAAFLAYYASFFFGVAAIVFGIIALVQGTNRRGMAIAGIALGATAIFLWTLFIALWIHL